MANTKPIRPVQVLTKKWSTVDSSTGQDISLSEAGKEWAFYIYEAGTTTLVDKWVMTSLVGPHTDDITMANSNPFVMPLATTAGQALFNIKSVSGNVDIHCLCLR